MEAGTKIVVTLKDGTTVDGVFVSAKGGWVNYTTKGVEGEAKARTKDVAEKLTKAEAARREKAAAKAAKDAEKAGEEAGDEVDGEGKLVPADLTRYYTHDTVTASGRKHLDIDDEVAKQLREKTLDQVYAYAAKTCDLTVKELKAKYEHLNPGMQRMNLGNKLRAAFRLAEKAGEEAKAEAKAKPAAKKKPIAEKIAKAEKKAKPILSPAGAAGNGFDVLPAA